MLASLATACFKTAAYTNCAIYVFLWANLSTLENSYVSFIACVQFQHLGQTCFMWHEAAAAATELIIAPPHLYQSEPELLRHNVASIMFV